MSPASSALLSTLGIGVAPVLLLGLLPIYTGEGKKRRVNQALLKVLLAFAVGGLLGDAFLHLIPHAYEAGHGHGHAHVHAHAHAHAREQAPPAPKTSLSSPFGGAGAALADGHDHGHGHDHDHAHGHDHHGHDHAHHHHHEHEHGHGHDHHHHEHDHGHAHDMGPGLWVLMGMLAFFVMEKLLHIFRAGHAHGDHGDGHRHDHSNGAGVEPKALLPQSPVVGRRRKLKAKAAEAESQDGEAAATGHGEIKIGGILNLIADSCHNFTDGMAIAASFLVSKQLGFTTTIAVIAHEIPHEIGDYALLIQSGFSARSAMLLQLVTAVFALVGCVVGLVSAGSGPTAAWILPFTAGGFIYIATVDVLPDLLKETNAKQTALEVAMMVLGVASMVAIANFEASH